MTQVADYKVIAEPSATLNSIGADTTIDFNLPSGALLVDREQRPFITFNMSAEGAMPQTVSVTLNGANVNTHTYNIDAQKATRTIIINGSTFVSGLNSLVFTLTSGAGAGAWNVRVSDVIVHFQQAV